MLAQTTNTAYWTGDRKRKEHYNLTIITFIRHGVLQITKLLKKFVKGKAM